MHQTRRLGPRTGAVRYHQPCTLTRTIACAPDPSRSIEGDYARSCCDPTRFARRRSVAVTADESRARPEALAQLLLNATEHRT